MVFPSNQVEFKAAHLPWLSAALVLVSLWMLLAIPAPQPFEEPDPEFALETAFRYWQGHGYLAADDRVVAAAHSHFDQGTPSFAIAVIRELGRRGMPERESEQDAEQATLDKLTRVAQRGPGSTNPLAPTHAWRVYGFTPASPTVLTAATHVFLHAGWIHFLAIVPLWFFLAASAELRWGTSRFALFTLSAAVISAGVHSLLEPGSAMSQLGAAGPTAALFSLYYLQHKMEPVRVVAIAAEVTPGIGRGYRPKLVPFTIPAVAIPGCWIGLNFAVILWLDLIGVRNDLSISAVAGGLGFGVIGGLTLQRFGNAADVPAREIASPAVQPEAKPEPVDRQIQQLIRRGELAEAADLWADQPPGRQLPPDDLVRLVSPLLAGRRTEAAVEALRQCVDAPSGEVSTGVTLQVLELSEGLDPYTTLLAARRVLELPDLHESKRTRVLALVQALDPADPTPFSEEELSIDDAMEAPGDEVQKELVPGPDLASLPRFEGIQPVAAVPTLMTEDVLYFRLDNGRKAKVAYAQIQALAVAALRDLSSKPVVVIDLLLNWTELSDAPLRGIRLRSDQFDPAQLIQATGTPTENLRAFLVELQARSGALPLPDRDAVRGQPFRVFKYLRGYQRQILKVDC